MNKENFCSLPFTEIFLGPDGAIKTCCSARTVLGNLNNDNIEKILQSTNARAIRQDILKGKWNINCTQCQNQENQGVNSERYNNIESFVSENNDINDRLFKLNRLDLRWSNTCNLSCTYCYEYFSSKWANIKGITVNTFKDKNEQDFLLFIEKNKDLVSNVQLLGGEPLLQKQNSKLIEILSNKNFYILSNLAVPLDKNLIAKSLIKQPSVLWGVSFETVGDRYEYVRHGASWEVFKENLNYLKSNIPDFKINAHSLYSIYSAFNLVEFYEFIIEQDVFENIFWNLLESSGENNNASVLNLDTNLKELAILEIEKCEKLFPNAIGIRDLVNIKSLLRSNNKNRNKKFIREISSLEEKLQKSFEKRFSKLWPTVWEKLL
jgi:MoaA/NifB/PqqE/SkfB family radical SAM enzyme